MSRARNIKPGFFKNDLLVELPFEWRILFVGLWTEADRDGRLEDRPTKLKMALFPADSVDVNAGLQALHDKGFILRYSVGESKYIQVLAWGKHQNPHVKEAKSTIPAPGEHGASTVQDTAKADTSRADSLIPDSLIPREKKEQASPRGSRLATGWTLPADWREWAKAERPDLDVDLEAAKFADYWHSQAGAKGRKADWQATWRNWVRNSHAARAGPKAAQQQPSKTMQGLMALEGMKRGLVRNGNPDGAAEAPLPLAGPDPGV